MILPVQTSDYKGKQHPEEGRVEGDVFCNKVQQTPDLLGAKLLFGRVSRLLSEAKTPLKPGRKANGPTQQIETELLVCSRLDDIILNVQLDWT